MHNILYKINIVISLWLSVSLLVVRIHAGDNYNHNNVRLMQQSNIIGKEDPFRLLLAVYDQDHSDLGLDDRYSNAASLPSFLAGDKDLSDIILLRGGGDYEEDYEYEYDDEEEEEQSYSEDEEDFYERRRPQRPNSSRGRGSQMQPRRPQRQGSRRTSKKSMLGTITDTTKAVTGKTANLAAVSVRESTKLAVGVASPKHVSPRQVVGVWRLDQTIELSSSRKRSNDKKVINCAANIRLDGKGNLCTTYEGNEMKSRYDFVERSWPRSCTIEFEARAFQGPSDSEPVNMFYKGYFTRKVMDRSVIKIEGKIYALRGRGIFKKRVLVGKFTARKRLGRIVPDNISMAQKSSAPASNEFSKGDVRNRVTQKQERSDNGVIVNEENDDDYDYDDSNEEESYDDYSDYDMYN